ncbi:LLM class flavin-dependent oxidoreductase [Flavobacterium sp. JP2137]|uniref:LLM class flavin-dependent oxidoreductase n=1 Tax=Flavobacterium sp. JP2137 TaxID=3414510 RepID=UPI003D2FF8CA
MNKLKIKLSALDQSALSGRDKTFSQALAETTALAKRADELGFTRFWVSEHHNAKSVASTAPEIFVAHIASHTQNIRVGAGGIMLPNHSALKVAESFKTLEALYPNRIDLGLGRAPGTDRLTATILNPATNFSESEFLQQMHDLEHYLADSDQENSVFEKVKAYPLTPYTPERWLLSSSGDSAQLAARMGLPLAYAHFITPNLGKEIVALYKALFVPSQALPTPKTSLALFTFCSEDPSLVQQQQALLDYRFILSERGLFKEKPVSFADIKDEKYTPHEQNVIRINRERAIYDTPANMKKRLDDLILTAGIDELMLVTYGDQLSERQTSMELIAAMYDIR